MDQTTTKVDVEGGLVPPSDIFTERYDDLPYLRYDDGGKWREHAKCRGNTELLNTLFFPDLGRGKRRGPVLEKAKEYCSDCPVRKECFNFAKKNDMAYGVWGGVNFFRYGRLHLKGIIPDDID